MPRYPSMRAINTKFATLSSTTRTVASFGIVGFLMGWVSVISGIGPPRYKSFDLPGQLLDIQWFLNITITPGLQGLFFIAAHYICGDSQNRYTLKSRHGFDLCSQSITVHIRHVNIHQDQIWLDRLQDVESIHRVGCLKKRIVLREENPPDQQPVIGIVFHVQNCSFIVW